MYVSAGTVASPTRKQIILKIKGVNRHARLRRFVSRCLETSVGRFERRIRQVTVWVEDTNGPRKGIDTRCRIDLRLHPRGRMSVEAHGDNEYLAIKKAADRARILLDRRYKRARTQRRSWLKRNNSRKRAALLPQAHETGVGMKSVNDNRDLVSIGSTITIRDLHSYESETYTLTHPNDADITRNRISSFSPMGKALYGRAVGDTVEVSAPGGAFHVRIEAVHRWPDGQLTCAGSDNVNDKAMSEQA